MSDKAIPNQHRLDEAIKYLWIASNHFSQAGLHIEEYAPTHTHLCEAHHALEALGAKLDVDQIDPELYGSDYGA